MIRHPISADTLAEFSAATFRQAITAVSPTWFKRARDVLRDLPANPSSDDFKSLWSDIKTVYMELQGSKCIYCEMPVEGKISNDVEHFRPKAKVSHWRPPKDLRDCGVQVTPPATLSGDPGYRFLAYHPHNYAASCKVCNSVLKKNVFPIAGTRRSTAKDPTQMKKEKAYLIYPIGNSDTDPADLIEFHGVSPQAKARPGSFDHQRALVTIDVFQLDDDKGRRDLFKARATAIDHLYSKFWQLEHAEADEDVEDARSWIDLITDRRSPHANCMRSFRRVYESAPQAARDLARDAKRYVERKSP